MTLSTIPGVVDRYDAATGRGVALAGGQSWLFGLTMFRSGRPARAPEEGDVVDLVTDARRLVAVRLRPEAAYRYSLLRYVVNPITGYWVLPAVLLETPLDALTTVAAARLPPVSLRHHNAMTRANLTGLPSLHKLPTHFGPHWVLGPPALTPKVHNPLKWLRGVAWG